MNNKETEQYHRKLRDGINTYFAKDIKEGTYTPDDYKIIAIGFLELNEPFKKGNVSSDFINKLRAIWSEGIILATMGFHTCEFCNNATGGSTKILRDKINKVEYVFPELLFHYIKEHNFKPDKQFISFIEK